MKIGAPHLREALREIAFHGTSRPPSYGSGDDGDGWYRHIAFRLISAAAWALKEDDLGKQLVELFGEEDAEKWLASPQTLLDGEIPNDLIEDGKLDEVMRLVAQLREGGYI